MTIGSAMLPLLRRHASSAELSVGAASNNNSAPLDTSPSPSPSATSSLRSDSRQTSPIDPNHPENKSFGSPGTFKIRKGRKPAPAIAARFKALGFGGDKRQGDQERGNDRDIVGRIPEDHINKLDSLHRANSTPTQFINRLGRTWSFAKGSNNSSANSPTATPPNGLQGYETPSTRSTSLTSQTPQLVGSSNTGFTVIESTIDRTKALNAAIASAPVEDSLDDEIGYNYAKAEEAISACAPRVEVTDMSTYHPHPLDDQKYRLPEHVNGNGTKAMPATKVQHLEREIEPEPEPEPEPELEPELELEPETEPAPEPEPEEEAEEEEEEVLPPTPPPKDELKQDGLESLPHSSSTVTMRAQSRPQSQQIEGTPADYTNEGDSYFNPFGRDRAASIYTLSRVSFASQLAQLTSLQLPDAESLATRVAAIPTSRLAAKGLTSAAEQIRSWISKAFEVLSGLDADDDVEWAAAGGREGLEDVDKAIARFDELINVYVTAIEGLQRREDIGETPTEELMVVVRQVESILGEWKRIKGTLKEVQGQVGVAIEWEELWNVVLGDIGMEMDILCRLVYEMEEKRHKSLISEAADESGVDLKDLETIVEETPGVGGPKRQSITTNMTATSSSSSSSSNRFSITSSFPHPGAASPSSQAADDSSLLALFARMQPLRASLDFLPMRLSAFHQRAEHIFPTACEELEARRDGLEESWKILEKDAESLRQELGEDRWVLVFRSAGRQASKMYESVGRSLQKLSEAIDAGQQFQNWPAVGQKIESYESKKIHYGPSIERVLSIIEKGVKDRLTINGEIVRLHSDMQKRWEDLKEEMGELDRRVQLLYVERQNHQLRDSVSSLVSNDRSTSFSSANETPGSSPASSVIMSNLAHGTDPVTPGKTAPRRTPGSAIPRKPLSAKSSGYGQQGSYHPTTAPRNTSTTPTGNRITSLPRPNLSASSSSLISRPRWNTSVKTNDGTLDVKYTSLPPKHSPLHSPLPIQRSFSDHARTPSGSKIPLRKSLGGEGLPPSPLSAECLTPLPTRPKAKANLSFRDRMSSAAQGPGPYSQEVLSPPRQLQQPRQLSQRSSFSNLGTTNRRQSIQPGQLLTPQPDRTKMLNRRSSMQLIGGGLGGKSIQQAQGAPNRATVGRSASSGLVQIGGAESGAAAPKRAVTSSLGHRAPTVASRAGSSLGNNRRQSLLPQPRGGGGACPDIDRGRRDTSVTGRESRAAVQGASAAMRRGSSAVSTDGSLGRAQITASAKPKWK